MPRPPAKRRAPRGSEAPYKTASGRWQVRVKTPGGLRYPSGKTRAEVITKRDELRRVGGGALGSTSTVGECLVWWRDEILPTRRAKGRGLSASTTIGYRWALGELIDGLGEIALSDLSTRQVSAFLAGRADHLSRNSLRILRVVLNLVLDDCVRYDDISRNVARLAVLPSDAREVKARRSLTGEECTRLLVAARGTELEHLFALLLLTGARRGELLALSWDGGVDLEHGTMSIRQGLRRRANGAWEIGETKTKGSVRTIRLSSVALAHLRERREQQLGEQVDARYWSNPGSLVFSTPTGHHLDPSTVARKWRELTKLAGLEGVLVHELRHTLGSHAVAAGVPLGEVADQLGHSTLDEVSRVYRHAVSPIVEGVAGVMDTFAPRA